MKGIHNYSTLRLRNFLITHNNWERWLIENNKSNFPEIEKWQKLRDLYFKIKQELDHRKHLDEVDYLKERTFKLEQMIERAFNDARQMGAKFPPELLWKDFLDWKKDRL